MSATTTQADRSSAAATAVRQFALDLQGARRAAGDPSYSALVRGMNPRFSKATISRVLNGARPSWRFTRCFLGACGVSDVEVQEIWRPRWTELQNTLRPLDPHDLREGASPGGAECTVCGVWATNTLRHADYHRQRGELSTSCIDPHMQRNVFDGERG